VSFQKQMLSIPSFFALVVQYVLGRLVSCDGFQILSVFIGEFIATYMNRKVPVSLVLFWQSECSKRIHKTSASCILCCLNAIRQIKSRRMRWAGHVARMGEGRNVYRVSVRKPKGKKTT
jgi:hypothetical protein